MKVQIKHLLCLALACLLIGGTTATFGQSTTGSLSGLVSAQEDGAALPGAQISAVHTPTGTRYSSITGDDGRFRILNVRVGGPYTVSAAMDSFHTQEANDVFVQLGENASLRFQLQLASIEETLVVVAESSPLINPSKTGAASNVTREAIESLPTVSRGFNDFARTNPFFTVTSDGQDPDAISVAGRNSRYNSITIDGSVNNDLFGLADSGTPGGQSGTTPISLDAIAELELVLADFDVKNGGFSGGGVNAITRSGTNQYTGSVFFYTRDKDFFGDGPDSLGQFGDFEEDQYGFRLGGPISKDKVFFFINADIEERVTPSGWSLDGVTGQHFDGGRVTPEAGIFRSYLMDNFGFDPGGLSENIRDNPSDKFFARVDFNLSDSHNLTVRHNYVDAANDINRPSNFTYEFPSETYDFQNETNSTVLQLNSVFGSNAFNEFRLANQKIKDRRGGRDGLMFPWIEIEDVNGAGPGDVEFEAGTEPFSTRNALDQDILEIHNDFTLLKGNHTITIGTHNELFTFDNLFVQNAFGSFEFTSLQDLLDNNARRFRYTIVPPGQPETQKFDVTQLGFYIGDQWTVKPNLTVNLGLRVDIPFFPDTPTRNPFTEATYGLRTDEIPDGEQLWQPRLGFNWDIEGNGESQLRGGAGVFAGRTPYVWISNQYARTGIEQIFVECNNVPFTLDPDALAAQCSSSGAIGEFNLIDPDFKFPQVLRYNLAYDRQLPWWDLIVSAEVVFSDSIDEIDYQNVNLTQTGTTFDGRPFYSEVDSGVDGAFRITNTGGGEQTNFAIKLERPFRDGVWGFVSYAFNESKVVNEGTSSRAVSNFNFNEAFDPNNTGVSTSDFEVEHRFNASLSYRFNRDTNYGTTVSLFYNLQSGRPFSWIMGSDFVNFGFGDSYNGDGTDGNDVSFVPATQGDVVFSVGADPGDADFAAQQAAAWTTYDNFVSSHSVLDAHRGGLVPRNSDQAPWNHTLDIHLAQDIPIKNSKLQLTLDILNLMNLFDKDSGTLRFPNFSAVEPWELEGICGTSDGHEDCVPGVDDGKIAISLRGPATGSNFFTTHNTRSRWRAKLGIRWSF